MSAPGKSKQGSRWGSLLQGAVANLESRLDNILAEENKVNETDRSTTPDPPKNATVPIGRDAKDLWARSRARNDTSHSRDVSRSGVEGRKSHDSQPDQSRSDTPVNGQVSQEIDQHASTPADIVQPDLDHAAQSGAALFKDGQENGDDVTESMQAAENGIPTTYNSEGGVRETAIQYAHKDNQEAPALPVSEYQAQIAQMRADFTTAEIQRQEDMHSSLERIDALQAKLQYLTEEMAKSSETSAAEASPDSLESQLAAKNQQIARLMEEGQKLSKAEVSQSTISRKLRAKAMEDARSIAELKRRLATAERAATDSAERTSRLEANFKETSARASRLARVDREVEDLRRSQAIKDETIEAQRRQIENMNIKSEADQKQAISQALEVERKVAQSLRDVLASLRIEKQLSDDKVKAQARSASEDLQREKQAWTTLEATLRNENLVLEGRLEVLRARTEEVSSGVTGESQSKLMRQIEMVQSQYAQASENWQGIEGALQARVSALESQKDEATRQETEARRKLRESGNNSRRIQEQLEETSRRCNVMEHDLAERQAHADKLQSRVQDFEKRLKEAQEGFKAEKQSWEAKLNTRIEEEKTKWRQEQSTGFPSAAPSQIDAPSLFRKASGMELPIPPTRRGLSRHASAEMIHSPMDRSMSFNWNRRASKPGRISEPMTPNGGWDSGRSTPFPLPPILDSEPGTPIMNSIEQDDIFDSASVNHQATNDAGSGSTAGPGPSVQLVERMSAAVRRLETEKSASKDEISRLSTQRDDARKEIVSLMKEVTEKRSLDTKVKDLEGQVADLNGRYHTTLEMLGEKSERVEELEADVIDLKKIYKDLVSSLK